MSRPVHLHSVKYPYRVRFIPKGKRNRRPLVLVAEQAVDFPTVASSKVRPSFRIHLRSENPRDFNVHSYEIIHFDGHLWWPLIDQNGPVKVNEFLAGLATGRAISLQHLLGRMFAQVDAASNGSELHSAREIGQSDQDEVLARLSKGVSETLLCGESVYKRGGEPVYLRPVSRVHMARCDVRSILAGLFRGDRVDRPLIYDPLSIADPLRDSRLPSSVGHAESEILEESMFLGALFRADELEMARALHQEQGEVETAAIEVLNGSAVNCDPVELQVGLFVRTLDCLFRQRDVSAEIGQQPLLEPIVREFRRLAIKTAISKEAGADAIVSLLQLRANAQRSSNSSLQYVFAVADMARGEISSNCARRGVELAALKPDDDALEELANPERRSL
jgi:hypothetical protein